MLLFFCDREWMKNRCKATVRTVAYSNGAVVQLVYHCTTQCSVLLFIYELPNAEAIHIFREIKVSFLYRKNRPFGRFLFWFWVKLITLRSRRF